MPGPAARELAVGAVIGLNRSSREPGRAAGGRSGPFSLPTWSSGHVLGLDGEQVAALVGRDRVEVLASPDLVARHPAVAEGDLIAGVALGRVAAEEGVGVGLDV
jgi:hypothetical protein